MEWISVEEMLPEDGIHVQVYRPEIQFVAFYKNRGTWGQWVHVAPYSPYMEPVPTHWMPLPPAPIDK